MWARKPEKVKKLNPKQYQANYFNFASMLKKIILILISVFILDSASAQVYSVKGKILDFKTKTPLAFVNIISSGETQGVSADIDGNFFISSPKKISELIF